MQRNVGKDEKCREMQKTSEKWIEMQDDVGRYENSQRSENSFKKGIWGNRLWCFACGDVSFNSSYNVISVFMHNLPEGDHLSNRKPGNYENTPNIRIEIMPLLPTSFWMKSQEKYDAVIWNWTSELRCVAP